MRVKEIENAITKLSNSELTRFATWFADYHARVWDDQIERDLDTGKLDTLLKKVDHEFDAGNAKPL